MITKDSYQEYIRRLPPADLLKLVLREHPQFLPSIAKIRFGQEATMENNDDREPFIRWGPINVDPQPWLPVLLGRVAQHEFTDKIIGNRLLVVSIPTSATWYIPHLIIRQIFDGANYPHILKENQLQALSLNGEAVLNVPVPSYVHGRDPLTKARRTQNVSIFNPQIYRDASVIVLDDALAEGLSAKTIAQTLVHDLRVRQVFLAVPMAKAVQRGIDNLRQSGLFSGLLNLVTVTGTHGYHQPIDYR